MQPHFCIPTSLKYFSLDKWHFHFVRRKDWPNNEWTPSLSEERCNSDYSWRVPLGPLVFRINQRPILSVVNIKETDNSPQTHLITLNTLSGLLFSWWNSMHSSDETLIWSQLIQPNSNRSRVNDQFSLLQLTLRYTVR